MLDSNLLDQLKELFSKLTDPVTLRVSTSQHESQEELLEMLNEVASTSTKLNVVVSDSLTSSTPYFEVDGRLAKGKLGFRGIPGGHEFSSLILAILHVDGKGKQPDAGITGRISRIKGPVRLKTYISLSCENCPEVVQALNLMATHHPDFKHEMVDGGMVVSEVEALGIQGVPSVLNEGQLVHSGKAQLIDLVTKLEEVFGKAADQGVQQDLGLFDVVVIGGGPAGATSAIYSVRKGLKTAVVAERLGGQLQETKGIENMISVPYTEGVKLAAQLGEHLASYPVQIFEHRRVSQITGDAVKRIQLESGEVLSAKAVIIATGAKWRQLGIPGEKEHIGMGVAFCAHCDGPFYKGKRVAVVGGGNSGVEAAIDLAGIATEVTLFEYNQSLKADGVLVEKLKALPNAKIVTNAKPIQVLGDGKSVNGLEFQDRATNQNHQIEIDGVFVQIGLLPNTQFLKNQLKLTPFGEIEVDSRGRTSVPGIYAAGDVTTIPFKQIVVAMGDGAKVALTAFEDRLHS